MSKLVGFLAVMPQKKGLKNVKFNFLQKQTSRRDILRGSVTLAGSAFLAHLLPATLLRASAAGYAQEAPSDALAAMRDWFNAFPLETEKLGEDLTMLSGPGGSVVVPTAPTANSSWTLSLRRPGPGSKRLWMAWATRQ